MDIYDFHTEEPNNNPPTGIDWEEAIAFGIAIIILTLSIVGLVSIIRMFM